MSAASFDDSSNLVDIVQPENNGDTEGASIADQKPQPDLLDILDEPSDSHEEKEQDSKHKSRKSKAKKLLKRAKSPISGAFNKTQKEFKKEFKKLSNLPKHHYSSPKSPSKSPSKENLTDEYSHLEEKLAEKKSEEWLAFQQMQDRIKQTVLKTQNSLNKYNSQSEDEEPKSGKSRWTDFNEDTALDPEELIDTSLAPAINISCDNGNSDVKDQPNFFDISQDISHLTSVQQASPPISPGPPVNSRISSMESLVPEQPKETVPVPKVEEEFDLLGLGFEPTTSVASTKASDLLTDDLLGLDSFLTPTQATSNARSDCISVQSDMDILSGYSFTSSASEDLVTSVTIQDKTPSSKAEDLFFDQVDIKENVIDSGKQDKPVDMMGDNFSDLDATPTHELDTDSSNQVENKMLAMLGEPLNPLTPAPVTPTKQEPTPISSKVSNTSVLDDFSSFDPMKADTTDSIVSVASSCNPFQASSNPVTILSDNQSSVSSVNMYGASPQSYGMMPAGSGSIDLISKIKMMKSGSQPASPARRAAPKPPKDPFCFVKKELKKKDEVEVVDDNDDDDGGAYKTLADIVKPKVEPMGIDSNTEVPPLISENANTETESSNATNNPFLTGDFEETGITASQSFTKNAAAMFGLDDETEKSAEADFDFDKAWETDIGDTKRQQWTDVNASDASANFFEESEFEKTVKNTEFEGDSAWDTQASDSKTGDVWGLDAGAATESNPFQDDFSKLDEVPVEKVASTTVNPFLSNDIATDCTQGGDTSTINPFFDFGEEQSVAKEQSEGLLGSRPMVLSDSENFFNDSVSEQQQDTSVTDDIFDPFKVTSKQPDAAATEDTLDLFSGAAPTVGSRPRPKASEDDDRGFKLEIKPASESGKDSTSPAPLLKPPPKPPKSPQPPRENPFDRDSPPEENFAQFEIKDIENPKEPPPKSLSTDSTTTEEEEVILEPLEPFYPKTEKEGFKLMLRYPTKKKIAGNRYWKHVFVKLGKQSDGPVVKVYNDAKDSSPLQELPLQPCYSLSDVALQQYDQYGKIHTVKLQYVFYKERVGIKTERITPSIVKFKKREKPKANMILDHSPQVSELLKFGSLDKTEILEFIREVEDTFMNLEARREKTLTYAKDEVTAEVHDEYIAELNKFGKVLSQKARVRIYVLAFLTGMPTVEVGLNDKKRRGTEVVGRNDIIPIKTEEWIRLEDVEFHCSVDKDEFDKTNNIKFQPLDACQFELLRYRVRLRENKELPLQLTIQQIFKHRKCEIRCDLLVTGYHSYSKKHGQFPCEDIEVRFPIPETWIYMFRYERRFGYGSIHSSTRKPGKIKGLERLTMMAQGHFNQTLMEADVGTAKYEHVYRSVVWRIPRLPVRNQGAYTSHLMKLRLELGPHDEEPDSFENYAHVEFTMPCSTVSQSQIRSIALTNSSTANPPEKWVRAMGHYQYKVEIEHLNEYPEMMAIGTVYKEATMVSPTKSEEENNEPEERDPRLAVSDTDSSDSD